MKPPSFLEKWRKTLIFQILPRSLQLTILNAVNNLHHLVIARSRHTNLTPLGTYRTIDRIHLSLLVTLNILQHTGLQTRMLANRYWYDKERDSLFERIVIIQKFHHLLTLDRLDSGVRGSANIDALLYKFLDDSA